MPASERMDRPRNPYLNRVMIRQTADFFGRRREVSKIFARIGAARPQSVSIVGERRIGKSSLLHYLCQPEIRRHYLDDPDTYTFVFIDLQEQRDIGISAFFENLFQAIEQAQGRSRPPGLPADYETARRALRRLQEEGRKIVLLFDEFDAITRNPNFPEEFFSFLRAVANKYDVAYVTTSRQDLQQLCHAERIADSPFFNIFSNLFLTRFEPEDAAMLIREPSKAAGVPLESHSEDVLDLAGMFPFFIQIACSVFFEELSEGGGLDVRRVQAAFREEAMPHFNYILEHFDDDQRRVLRDVAGRRPIAPNLSYLLARLRRDGYLLEHNGRERVFSSAFTSCLEEAAALEPTRSKVPADASGRVPESSGLAGRQLGSFRIVSLIGAGAMGVVYRAWDLKLEREVAVKVLPGTPDTDPPRLERFQREARALAALNHPNIGAIYGMEESGDVRALVLELVEGPTLAELIAEQSGGSGAPGLDLEQALSLARQIAGAIEAAHAKGILHRDLKPANIKITPAGMKVLDFGLAKVWADESAGALITESPTLTAEGTLAGTILGTAAYMSPEQARGRRLDKRTDIWSFGCVMLEMLTGRPAFAGETLPDTLARVLEREPDWQAVPRSTPGPMRDLLRRCLQKDPNLRFHDIADVRIHLDEIALKPAASQWVNWWSRLTRLTRRGDRST